MHKKNKNTLIAVFLFVSICGLFSPYFINHAKYYSYAILCQIHRNSSFSHAKQIEEIDQEKFIGKLKGSVPLWMSKQISKELSAFKSHGISQSALSTTYNQTNSQFEKGGVFRIRIIDNAVYVHSNLEYHIRCDPIFTLLLLIEKCNLPRFTCVDFLVSYSDGFPRKGFPSNFWVTENFQDQAPIFTQAKLELSPYLVCIPDRLTTVEWPTLAKKIKLLNSCISWEKKQKCAFWRGGFGDVDLANSPSFENLQTSFINSPRYILGVLSNQYPASVNAGYSKLPDEPNIKNFLTRLYKSSAGRMAHLKYAYLPTLDGVMCTYPGFLWRLLSNSVAFKQESGTSQWFYNALEPYKHYIPIKQDLSDLMKQIQWARDHDSECKKISANARDFVENHLMIEDIYAYFYLLLKTYEDCLSLDQQQIIDEINESTSWVKLEYN